jgi:hypothetical protein
MTMFSKNTKTILTYLAILIIFYGAYKAVFNLKEGKKGKKRKKKSKSIGSGGVGSSNYEKVAANAKKKQSRWKKLGFTGKNIIEGMVPLPGEKYINDKLYNYGSE